MAAVAAASVWVPRVAAVAAGRLQSVPVPKAPAASWSLASVSAGMTHRAPGPPRRLGNAGGNRPAHHPRRGTAADSWPAHCDGGGVVVAEQQVEQQTAGDGATRVEQ